MRIAYDKGSHGLYIRFSPETYVESEEVSPGGVIDFDERGKPIALEIEDARGMLDEPALRGLSEPRISSGADLRDFRERLGLTQQLLGRLLGIPKNTIARWERGELAIEKPRLLELALASLTSGAVEERPGRPGPRIRPAAKRTSHAPARQRLRRRK